MKILAIGLLRLGDLVMMTPTFRGLKESAPGVELHVIINKECRAICGMIPWVDRWIEFDRGGLQSSLGEMDFSLIGGFLKVRDLVTSLENENYQAVYNLTHNRLSGWLAGLIGPEVRAGLTLTHTRRSFIASEWFRYLNDHTMRATPTRFHMADVFYSGSGLADAWHPFELNETEKGFAEANLLIGEAPFILVQTTTSDTKKTWSGESYAQMLRLFSILHPDHKILLIGAPDESYHLSLLERRLMSLKVPAQKAIVSLEAVLSLCERADLLITGDTSIKHIAAATDLRIVEIAIGSSDPFETGVYSADNLIIWANESCAPCAHSSPCSRPTHACGERLSPECVALASSKLMQRDFAQLKVVAEQYRDEACLMRTEWSESGCWQALPLVETFQKNRVGQWVERFTWQLFLSGMHDSSEAQALRLKGTLKRLYPRQSVADWLFLLSDLEQEILQGMKVDEGRLVPAKGDDLVKFRQRRNEFENLLKRKEIELNIVRTLRAEMGR